MPQPITHVQIASIWIDVALREQHNSSASVTKHPVEDGSLVADHVQLEGDQLQIEGVVTNTPIEMPGSHMGGVQGRDTGVRLNVTEMQPMGTSSVTIRGEPSLGVLGLFPLTDQANSIARVFGADARRPREFQMVTPALAARPRSLPMTALGWSGEFDRVTAVHNALRETFRARKPVQVVTKLRVYASMVMTDLTISVDGSSGDSLRFTCAVEEIVIVKSQTGIAGAPDPVNVRAKPAVDAGNQNTVVEDPPADAAESVSAAKQLAAKNLLKKLGDALLSL